MTVRNAPIKLTFLGGVGTVTGSKTLVEINGKRILVDCGLFQGIKDLRILNWKDFPIDPSTIDAIVLTHAHLDHCGYIPLLVKKGFKGPIHCTYPTLDLTEIILKDSAKIQEEDAEQANKNHYTKHPHAEPLYTVKDVIQCLPHFVGHNLNEWVIINEYFKFEFLNSGHILGGAFVHAKTGGKTILFSGDIGRSNPMLLYPPKHVKSADYLILESTYGDRLHQQENVKQKLKEIIDRTIKRGGILMIPSFAVERTQEILYLIYQLREEEQLPKCQVFLDSPMGINATNTYKRYPEWQKISNYELDRMFEDIHLINDIEQSKSLVADKRPKIVLAGSGMIEGGRILHYLNSHIDNPNDTLLMVGYQGEGTRGRAILNGSTEIKFFGEYRKIKCEVEHIDSLSAHADYSEMIEWLKGFRNKPKKIILNHGETHQTDAFRARIQHELQADVLTPKMMESVLLID
ncbi:MBL fold metallo-hydrolase [Fluviicola sp.]|jgi:metallo-beta-lactamase family protein|uniref:MBL fold metallo-hydrolase n=1 Tax=Fluviicola sp. TaxID=1917219 RepID=UPI0028269534|nr:MBL fold metallo-hydrolase [Fluviicola sp.]MDR0802459.1 MBL fold metallo-hydrolase [Fluviicola sp.]